MSDIKMKDVFELPIQQGEHEPFVLDCNKVYICETESSKQAEAATIAINGYDSNQERIAELEAQVELLRDIPHICGRFSCRHCTTLSKTPQQCLAEAKASL